MPSNNNIYKMSNAGGFKSLTRYYDMLAGNAVWNPWEPAGAYESIAAVTVPSGGLASVTFSSIPQTYSHLQLRVFALNTAIPQGGDVYMRLNGDTGSNYNAHYLYGGGSSAAAGVNTNTYVYAAFNAVTNPGVGITDILDYTSTNKNKTTRSLIGNDRNGAGDIALTSGLWLNTSAITSISVFPGANSFAQYSQIALYGIKG